MIQEELLQEIGTKKIIVCDICKGSGKILIDYVIVKDVKDGWVLYAMHPVGQCNE